MRIVSYLLILVVGLGGGIWLGRTFLAPTPPAPPEQPPAQQQLVGAWILQGDGALLEFKSDGSFEQIHSEKRLAPGEVIADLETAQKAKWTEQKIHTIGKYRWEGNDEIIIAKYGVPEIRLKVECNGDSLNLIAEGGRCDRYRRAS